MVERTNAGGWQGLVLLTDYVRNTFPGTAARDNLIVDARSGGKTIDTRGADDRVSILSDVQQQVTVNLGDGNDVGFIYPGAKAQVNGDGGKDTLVINGDVSNYTLAEISATGTSGTLRGSDGTEVRYNSIEVFHFRGLDGNSVPASQLKRTLDQH